MEKLLQASFEKEDEVEDVPACQFGWVKKDNRYFNLYSGDYNDDEHPCCQ
jgi:hypothetical protein